MFDSLHLQQNRGLFCGDESSVKTVETVLSDFSGIDFDELKKYICLFYGDRALLHLFRVAGGIESMVIGEDEILGQLKRAYAFAKDNSTVAYELNMCVQAAVACAKKLRPKPPFQKHRFQLQLLRQTRRQNSKTVS